MGRKEGQSGDTAAEALLRPTQWGRGGLQGRGRGCGVRDGGGTFRHMRLATAAARAEVTALRESYAAGLHGCCPPHA